MTELALQSIRRQQHSLLPHRMTCCSALQVVVGDLTSALLLRMLSFNPNT